LEQRQPNARGRRLAPPWERRRALVEREASETSEKYGSAPEARPLRQYIASGVVNVDKPAGPTSHEVAAWVKRLLGVSAAGHSGTLDPGVTGVLPTCLERASRIVEYMHLGGKEYVGVAELHQGAEEERLRETLGLFVGEIYQRPPVRSSVARRVRVRTVYYLEMLEMEGRRVLFRVGCDSGTYIRKLVHDIGLVLGVGAHMAELRRTRDGALTCEEAATLYDVAEAAQEQRERAEEGLLRRVVRPLEEALSILPAVYVKDSAVDAICHGAAVSVRGVAKLHTPIEKGEAVAIKTLKGEAVALGKAVENSDWMLESERGIAVETRRVVMEPGTYPRMWRSRAGAAGEERPRAKDK